MIKLGIKDKSNSDSRTFIQDCENYLYETGMMFPNIRQSNLF